MKNYLQNRKQRVVLDNHISDTVDVLSGVPQGSIIGPLLFVLFINDIYKNLDKGTNVVLYADDTKMWRQIDSHRDCKILQKDITALNEWCIQNKMKFHPDKCKVLTVSNNETCYSNSREFLKRRFGVSSGYDRNKQSGTVCLKLPYLSEYTSNQILKFIKKHNIPISVTFTPGKKLRDIFCSSRLYDKPQCVRNNCAVCINLEDGCCATKTLVYLITCILCNQQYVGESGRSVHDRLSEHLRYAKNPTIKATARKHSLTW